MRKRFAYFTAGYVAGTGTALMLEALFTVRSNMAAAGFLGIMAGTLALKIAERTKRVKTIEELNQPLTIFPRNSINNPRLNRR